MKFQVDRDTFADAVSWTAKSLPTRPSVPVLAGARLSVDEGELTISGFDYEISTRVTVAVTGESAGTTLVSGKLLSEIVKALPNKPVNFTVDGPHAELTCGSARFTLPTMPLEDYPSLPQMPEAIGTIDADEFAKAVAQTAIAAGKDETLPTMTGVQLELTGGGMGMLATDRYRMAIRDSSWEPGESDVAVTVLVPAKALADTARTFGSTSGNSGGSVTIAVPLGTEGSPGMVGFIAGGRQTTSRVLDGQLPPLRSLLATSYSTTLKVKTSDLIEVARRVALVGDRNSPIRLSFDEDGLVVEAGGAEDAKASEGMDCVLDGEPGKIAFNPTYLLDGLSVVDAPVTAFKMNELGKPVVMSGEGAPEDEESDTKHDGYLYMLQPLRWDA
ncbi:DNA polymerase III subunit beta [Glycomyces buryatensis]|uniref:Beta sliding clamp n=1 Tax=Glycomyces buryatensis TaxID=2570927 RepID=A0A4S8Q8U0_9ACTN|nr:DNA polymerase III subunit beta [Glycomyces buryatensis]THV40600.1 DNA polymerase III subunit beta [Glycomyces buryatensis]